LAKDHAGATLRIKREIDSLAPDAPPIANEALARVAALYLRRSGGPV
jgi:hypothetical protein